MCCCKMLVLVLLTVLTATASGRPGISSPYFNVEEPFIIGGTDSAKGNWPWQLSLEYYHSDMQEWRHTCGASLLDATHALTAAHCTDGRFPGTLFRVVLGQFDRSAADYEDIIEIVDIKEHENFTILGHNDIAVVYLEREAEYNEYVQPGIVPPFGQEWPEEDCVATGWGLTHGDDSDIPDKLQEVEIMPLTTEVCQERMLGLNGPMIGDGHICVDDHDESGQVGACNGDSGGPLNCVDAATWFVAGVCSWGISTPQVRCDTSYPTVYTRVSHYHDWIMETIGGQ